MIEVVALVIRAWQKGNKAVRGALICFAIAEISSIVSLIATYYTKTQSPFMEQIQIGLIVFSGIGFITVAAIQEVDERHTRTKETKTLVDQAQKKLEDPDTAPGAAWELAQIKIEEYLNKNIQQVTSIFRLVVMVCLAGFALIAAGIVIAIYNKDRDLPAIISASSGVMVSFISATFLLVYKNAMEQAKDYMQILERINAVGMSVSILKTIDKTGTAQKDQALIEVSKLLLQMYSPSAKSSAMSSGAAKTKKTV